MDTMSRIGGQTDAAINATKPAAPMWIGDIAGRSPGCDDITFCSVRVKCERQLCDCRSVRDTTAGTSSCRRQRSFWDGGGGSVEDTYLIDVKTENE